MNNAWHERHNFISREIPIILKKNNAGRRTSPEVKRDILPSNWHEDIEIIYVVSGRGIISADFEQKKLEKGDIFVINADVFHGFASDFDDEPFCYYYLIIDRAFCVSNGFDTYKVRFEEKIHDDDVVKAFEEVIENYSLDKEYRGLAVRSSLLRLLYFLAERHIDDEMKDEKKGANVENIRATISYIKENMSKKLTIKELARASGMSEYHFIREFKRILGYTPVTYINVIRCDTALKLLTESKMNVGEVAAYCGFDNVPYFSKTFKKYIGVLPSEIKKEKKNLQ